MSEFLSGLLGQVFGWMASVLPQDPFVGYLSAVQGLQLGLAWLNWVFPVSDAVTFLGVWMGTVASYVAGRKVVNGLLDVGTSIVKVV